MSDDSLSKRERQKQRRQQKLEDQRQQQRRARARTVALTALVLVVVLAGIGVIVVDQVSERRAAAERAEEVAGRLDELGCTEIEHESDFGGGQHLSGQALATNAPEDIYNRLPTSAGPHLGSVAAGGVYDETIDERLVVHNLEHGYVAFWWDPDAPQETVDAVKEFVETNFDAYPKLIAAPYNTDLPEGQTVTAVAWTYRQECGEFDPDVAMTFIDEHYGLAGDAPEKNIEPHSEGGQGVVAEPVLFPPLDTAAQAAPTETPQGDPGHDPTAAPTPSG